MRYKKYSQQAKQCIKGESFFESIISDFAIPHHIVGQKDIGIDYIYEWTYGDKPSGVLFAVQIKTFSKGTATPTYIDTDTKQNMLGRYEIRNSNFNVDVKTLLHLIVSGPHLPGTIRSLKSYTAKQLLDSIQEKQMNWLLNQLEYYKARHKKSSQYQVWQEGYHPQQITSEAMLLQKVEYIHYNPVRRGYVKRPEHWRYSSAGEILMKTDGELKVDLTH